MTKYVLTVLVAGMLLSTVTAADDAKKDKEALQGAWRIVSSEAGGKDRTEEAKATSSSSRATPSR